MHFKLCLPVICASLHILFGNGLANHCAESGVKSCGKCIAISGCAWCEYPKYADDPNSVIPRCDLPENFAAEKCPAAYVSNPSSESRPTQDDDLSNVGESEVGKATQIKPQSMEVKLRPGVPVDITVSFKQAEDYPVDLYYLLDLSKSMKNDLESLRALGKQLGESMQNITRDFRLGFGSFIDKTVMPYISTVPAKLKNPCEDREPCDPPYSFHNDLPLTSEIQEFVNSVNNVSHSSNLDNPEGGLDAIMQAIVCQDKIKWREQATHLLVFSTDATFHYAGDGKLGGIVMPNDGACHLNAEGHYTKANELDYPSIGHLVRKITEHNVQPIFAVTETVIKTYEKLQKMIPKSVVGELSEDSNNIIDLIKDAYNDLKGQILLEIKSTKEVKVVNKMSHCKNSSVPGLKCDGVKLGDVVNFTFTLTTDKCIEHPFNITVKVYGYKDMLNITVMPQCECSCNVTDDEEDCSGNGHFECGACVCDTDYVGLDCSCDLTDAGSMQSYLDNCTDPNTGVVCNTFGECECGKCKCSNKDFPDRKIYGKYCQCDDVSCSRYGDKVCNGNGTCDCGVCKCNDGWKGDACECSLDDTPCLDTTKDAPDPTKPCNGNGACECGHCNCFKTTGGAKFFGGFCEVTPNVVCEVHRFCIVCRAFPTDNEDEAKKCDENCQDYNVTKMHNEGSGYSQKCRFTDPNDECSFEVYFEDVNGVIMVDVDTKKNCRSYANPTHVIVGIIAAIVVIGLALLLIWKLITSIKDAREFKNFQNESKNPNWQGGENPIYKKATSRFQNPIYTGGKPSGGL